MSHRFVRCPHCKIPHDAAERVCPNTGLHLPVDARSHSREGRRAEPPGVGAARDHGRVDRRTGTDPLIGRHGNSTGESGGRRETAFDGPRSRASEHDETVAAGGRRGSNEQRRAEPSRREERRDVRDVPATLRPQSETQHGLIGQTIGDRYRVRGILGEGGMGTVYDAEHLGLSRQVAIKVLSQAQAKKRVAVKRFQQEARAAGAIGHPNICEVYDLGLLDDGSPYLVMEKLVGQTLAERIGKEGGLPFDEVVEVIVQVLSGLVAVFVAAVAGVLWFAVRPAIRTGTDSPPTAPLRRTATLSTTHSWSAWLALLPVTTGT